MNPAHAALTIPEVFTVKMITMTIMMVNLMRLRNGMILTLTVN